MFHGRKKTKPVELTEEQKKERHDKNKKIDAVNKLMLEMRAQKVYDEARLAKTEKFAKLSPDFSTVWNYRREILAHLFEKSEGDNFGTLPAKLNVIKGELMMLLKGLKDSPKSYTLWFHRQWIIEKGLEMETLMIKAMRAKKLAAEKAAKEAAAAAAAKLAE